MELLKHAASILPIVFPIIAGIIIALYKRSNNKIHSFSKTGAIVIAAVQSVLVVLYIIFGAEKTVCFHITDTFSMVLKKDIVSVAFSALTTLVCMLTAIFGSDYMRHEDKKMEEDQKVRTLSGSTFFCFYFMVWGVLIGLGQAGNMITFYMFYELMTISSAMLVIHDMTKEAVFAVKKYLYYSIAGASLAIFGFAVLAFYVGNGLEFSAGASIADKLTPENTTLILVSVFMIILGFGTKGGLFPMHGWLPTAHPVAPAAASAVLSGIITKAGVLGVVRIIFYFVGANTLKGTWVQYTFIILTLITVFMGSMLAYKEKLFKKRLAYSTVSQVSYILFGISCLNPLALMGAFMHVIFHSILKTLLFLNAGSIIFATGKKNVSEYTGIGRVLPITMLTFTIASLGLVGIPPVCGFVSKYYLCLGSLELPGVLGYIGVLVLLVSALLTAGYLFSISVCAFFPGERKTDFNTDLEKNKTLRTGMIVVMCILAVLAVVAGIYANVIYDGIIDFVFGLF